MAEWNAYYQNEEEEEYQEEGEQSAGEIKKNILITSLTSNVKQRKSGATLHLFIISMPESV